MSAVVGTRPGPARQTRPRQPSGTGYPGPRRPRGVDEAAGAALDLVVRAIAVVPSSAECRDRGVRARTRLGGNSAGALGGGRRPGRPLRVGRAPAAN